MNTDAKKIKLPKWLPVAVLVVGVLGGAVWLWEDVLEDRLIPKRWAAVEGHDFYRSGQLSARLIKKMLVRHNIQVIVALTGRDPKDRDQEAEEKAAAELGIELHRFPLTGDGTGDIQQYAGALTTLIQAERQGRTALIHCAAGVQRTGGTIAFLRLLVDKRDAADVVRELRRHGWRPRRNPHLLPYLNENLPRLAAILRDQGLFDEIPNPLPVLQTP